MNHVDSRPHRRRVAFVAVVGAVALAFAACREGDGGVLISDPNLHFTAATCDTLAVEYASELEDRSLAAIEDLDRDPFYVTEDIGNAMTVTYVALDARQDLGCDVPQFMKVITGTLSDRFKREVPRWLSSEDVGNTWQQYQAIVLDYVEGAFVRD